MRTRSVRDRRTYSWQLGCLVLVVPIVITVYGVFFHRPLSVARHIRALGGTDGWQALTIFAANLRGTKCSDKDLDVIATLGALRYLELDNTAISDSGVRTIGTIHSLTKLTLDSTNVTDEGLRHLSSLRQLQYLSVKGTRVTSAGIRRLQTDLPNLELVTDMR
jgi:hypothetical protein